jgi:hypothetical protein
MNPALADVFVFLFKPTSLHYPLQQDVLATCPGMLCVFVCHNPVK